MNTLFRIVTFVINVATQNDPAEQTGLKSGALFDRFQSRPSGELSPGQMQRLNRAAFSDIPEN
jgi:hypothetical protein